MTECPRRPELVEIAPVRKKSRYQVQKLSAVPSEAADNHRSLLEPILGTSQLASHPDQPSVRQRGCLLTGGDLEQPRAARIRSRQPSTLTPRRPARTEASAGTQGTVGLGTGHRLLPLLPRCTRERGSARRAVLPEHLLLQPRTPGAAAVQMPECGRLTPPLRPLRGLGASTRDPPTPRRPRRRPARGSALPAASRPRSRKPEAVGG